VPVSASVKTKPERGVSAGGGFSESRNQLGDHAVLLEASEARPYLSVISPASRSAKAGLDIPKQDPDQLNFSDNICQRSQLIQINFRVFLRGSITKGN
jgi:hypothetical protein